MGFRFRKSFKIAPGVKLNINKKSAGLTFGGKGAHFTMNTKGKNTTSVGVPSTGLYYTSTSGSGNTGSNNSGGNGGSHYGNNYNIPSGGNYGGGNNHNNFTPPQKPKKNYTTITILLLIFFFPLGLYFMWAKTNWNKIVKIVVSIFIGIYFLFFAVAFLSDSDSSLPASSSGITKIHCYEDEIRLDLSDSLNDHETVNFDFKTNEPAGQTDLLNSDFVIVFDNENIADAQVDYLYDYTQEISVTVKGLNPGTTNMHVETTDGTVKSNEIVVEVIGEKPTYSWGSDSTDETTTETTTRETTTERETTTRETTTEETTKDNSRTVYTTPTGEKYHFSKSCAGKNAIEHTLNEVKDTHEPCKKCAQ